MRQLSRKILDQAQDGVACAPGPEDACAGSTRNESHLTPEPPIQHLSLEREILKQPPVSKSGQSQTSRFTHLPDNALTVQDATNLKSSPDQEILGAFYGSPQRLEIFLMKTKKDIAAWQLQVLPIIEQGLTDGKGSNILIMASSFGNTLLATEIVEDVIKYNVALVKSYTIFGNTGLHYAAFRGHKGIITRLLEHGAKAGTQNKRGMTALHVAIRKRHLSTANLLTAAMSVSDMDAVDDLRYTALHLACMSSRGGKLTKFLLEAGCQVTKHCLWGRTALELCVWAGRLETAEIVRTGSSGPNPRKPDYWKSTPILTRKSAGVIGVPYFVLYRSRKGDSQSGTPVVRARTMLRYSPMIVWPTSPQHLVLSRCTDVKYVRKDESTTQQMHRVARQSAKTIYHATIAYEPPRLRHRVCPVLWLLSLPIRAE